MSYDRWIEGAYDRNPTGNNPYAPEVDEDEVEDYEPDPDRMRDEAYDRAGEEEEW